MSNMSLKMKLMTGFILVAIIAAVIGGIGIIDIKKIDNADTVLYEKITVPLGEIGEAAIAFQRMRCNLAEMQIVSTSEELKDLVKRVVERQADIAKLLASFEKTLVTEEGKKRIAELKKGVDGFNAD